MKKRKQFIEEFFDHLNLTKKQIDELLKEILTDKQVKIFKLRYDSFGYINKSMSDIAKEMGTTKQNIEQRLNTICKRIDKYCAKNNINISPDARNTELYPSKTEQLIKTINSLHNLPPTSGDKNVKFDVDGSLQRKYYYDLQKNARIIEDKIKSGKSICKEEAKILSDFKEVEQHLEIIVPSDRAHQLGEAINELKRLPKTKKSNNGKSEKTFEDGIDQRRYYDVLVADIKKIKEKDSSKLVRLEKQKLVDYNYIMKIIDKFRDYKHNRHAKFSYQDRIDILRRKADEYINTIIKYRRCNIERVRRSNPKELIFFDESDKITFYYNLKRKVTAIKKDISDGKKISSLDEEKLKCFSRIDNVGSFFPRKYFANKLLIIEIFNEYNIDYEKNSSLIGKPYGEVYAKLRYLEDNNIPILNEDGELNKIFYMADLNMQAEFGISLDEIITKYINGDMNCKETLNVFRKLP